MKTQKTIAELIEVIPDAALILNRDNQLVMVNAMLTEMFGYSQRRELLGQPLDILLPDSVRSDHSKHVASFFTSAHNRPMGRGLKFAGQRKDGSTIYVEIMLSHVDFDGEHFAIAFVRDATNIQMTEDKIRRELEHERKLAQTDHLTGLANRRAFVEALDNEIHNLNEHGLDFAVCFIDLDDFKKINDTHGHQMGDEVLQQIGHVIATTCRANDLVARIGGDEFATIHVGATLQDAMTVLERIREKLVHEFAEHDWPVTLSMGICHCNDAKHHFDVATILRAADKAMYEAKKQGKNQIKIAHVAAV